MHFAIEVCKTWYNRDHRLSKDAIREREQQKLQNSSWGMTFSDSIQPFQKGRSNDSPLSIETKFVI